MSINIIDKLKERGCIHDASHIDELKALLQKESLTFYCGFDPTSDSLQAGNMVPLLIMRRLQEAGHKPIILLGSATGMIGDPSGKSEERKLLDDETLKKNLAGLEKQFKIFLSDKGSNAYTIVKNSDWLNKMNMIEFLRDVGKFMTVNYMMAKDSVKSRLENRDQGISYTEFSYMLLQGYDFYWLNKNANCRLQVGGSDQWGNITAGLDLIHKKNPEATSCYGLTFPLLTTSTGAKFGKTEKGTIWLSSEKTSPYNFYQYWYNTTDEDIIKYILIFTPCEGKELEELKDSLKTQPEKRQAQQYIASYLTTLVHGEGETKKAQQASRILFGEKFENIDAQTLREIFAEVPSTSLASNEVSTGNLTLADLLVRCSVSKSKGEARRLIEGGGVYLNNEKNTNPNEQINLNNFISNSVLVIRSGKKNYHLLQLS